MRNLPEKMLRPYIKLQLERPMAHDGRIVSENIGETPSQTYENPVYNKRFQFPVAGDADLVRIMVVDA